MSLRIGSAQGFYGDDVTRALPMIRGGHVDVVCFEALSELTLAILRKDMLANPARGFTFDINLIAKQVLPEAYSRKIPLITNGGGLNPIGAADTVRKTASELGLHGLKIAVVSGDDFLPRLDSLPEAGEALTNIETGEEFAHTSNKVFVTANVYLGAAPIVEALRQGADIVITGRVADPCLYLAPMIAHYGWEWDNWNLLASGIAAGHLLECTGQVVGGNSLGVINDFDPHALAHLGYPIAHIEKDGTFTVTKTPNSPGCVTLETVKEQLLYEVHDPAAYVTPDVVADFTTLHLTDSGKDRVQVTGVTGHPRPNKLKLSMGRMEGYIRELIFTLGYPETDRKFEQLQTMISDSWRGLPIERLEYHKLGVNSLFGRAGSESVPDPLELVVRVMFTAADPETLKTAVRRVMANGLSCPAGMSVSGTTVGAEPRVILGLWSSLIGREHVQPSVHILEIP